MEPSVGLAPARSGKGRTGVSSRMLFVMVMMAETVEPWQQQRLKVEHAPGEDLKWQWAAPSEVPTPCRTAATRQQAIEHEGFRAQSSVQIFGESWTASRQIHITRHAA